MPKAKSDAKSLPVSIENHLKDAGIPHHRRILVATLRFFMRVPGAEGAFLSGSTASGGMDRWSDLDVGILFRSASAREACWRRRWQWRIVPWFHRFDADHIKPHFVIYFFKPWIKVDVVLYVRHDLPPPKGGPYAVAWDSADRLRGWFQTANRWRPQPMKWAAADHDDERFWAWCLYLLAKVGRGEFYHAAEEFGMLRSVAERLYARLTEAPTFDSRRIEVRGGRVFARRMAPCFPSPNRRSLLRALRELVRYYEKLRRAAENRGCRWRTSQWARRRIHILLRSV